MNVELEAAECVETAERAERSHWPVAYLAAQHFHEEPIRDFLLADDLLSALPHASAATLGQASMAHL